MTQNDLKIEYRKLSGKYPPDYNIPDLGDARQKWREDMSDYIMWLEQSLVDAHNRGTGAPTDTVLVVQNGRLGSKSNKLGG